MVRLATLNTIADLEQEMARSGRVAEQRALHAVLGALISPAGGYMTTGEAAATLQVSIPTIKRWVQRRVLAGVSIGTRWLISQDSVNQVHRVRSMLHALDEEGNPSADELQELLRRPNQGAAAQP